MLGYLIRFFIFVGRALLLVAPQTILSLMAMQAYVRAGIFPVSGVPLHLSVILAGELIFFGLWALAPQAGRRTQSPWFRWAFAFSLLVKYLVLNATYVTSYASYQLWSAYITWQNLTALLPHLEGFHAALGSAFSIALVLIFGGLLSLGALFYRLSPRGLRWLRWTYHDPCSGRFGAASAALVTLVAAYLAFTTVNLQHLRDRDPLLAFWQSAAGREPALTPAMLADRADAVRYVPPSAFDRRNVIVFVVDCLRADHLSFLGYHRETTPFLTSLARAGRIQNVDFAMANGNDSPQGIRTVLGSRYPQHHNIYNFKLHDVLKRAGYHTHVIATGDHTTLGDMRRHYGPNLDVFADGLTSITHSVNDDGGLIEALDRIPSSNGEPAFFFFHLMSPHTLGVRDPAFQRWNPSLLKMDWSGMITGTYSPELMTNTYDNGIYQADDFVRRIMSGLEAKGYLRDYIGVLTGDHGEGLGERGNFGHTRFLFMEDIRVPILFFESIPVDYGPLPFGSHVDIAPTLLDRLGLPAPARWEGRSLFRAAPPTVTFAVGSRRHTWQAVVLRDDTGTIWKYLTHVSRVGEFGEYLFNLDHDPGERTNLLANDPELSLADRMRRHAAEQFDLPNFASPSRAPRQ